VIEERLLIGFGLREGESHSHAGLGKGYLRGHLEGLALPVDAHNEGGAFGKGADSVDIASTLTKIGGPTDDFGTRLRLGSVARGRKWVAWAGTPFFAETAARNITSLQVLGHQPRCKKATVLAAIVSGFGVQRNSALGRCAGMAIIATS